MQITAGPYDDGRAGRGRPTAAGSPSPATAPHDPDANDNSDIFVVEAKAGADAARACTIGGRHRRDAACSAPDGKSIAYIAGGDPKDIWYATNNVAVVPVAGGEPRALTARLDRNVVAPALHAGRDGRLFLLEDGGQRAPRPRPCRRRRRERVVGGERDVDGLRHRPATAEIVGARERPAIAS